MIMKSVTFRVDASMQIGTGHVMRCLTLADALKSIGVLCHFICREHPGNLIDQILQRGYPVSALPKPPELIVNNEQRSNYEGWLGVEWMVDAAQTKANISEIVDWLIVDHYAIDASWEQVLRTSCRRLMVIDDIANRPHLCDLLVDQNYEDQARYSEFVPKDCRLLLGASYALLRPEYAQYRAIKILRPHTDIIKRAFIFFGGADALNLTGMALKAFSIKGLDHIELDVVVGANYLYHEQLNQLAVLRGRTNIHKPRPHLADLMVAADIAIGGGGATNWERMCLGLPSIVITLAENQTPISEILNRRGVLRLLGKLGDVSIENISDALLSEIKSRQISDQVASAMDLCDGLGVARVINAMTSIQ
jgi:UDP-2,4-diacetamido-2,4,6-trideoxy-beta-L-altropyranose hydrolase